jgi:undecaprenyl-diphosphatase
VVFGVFLANMPCPASTAHAATPAASRAVRPEYRWLVDAPLLAAGAGCWLTSLGMNVDRQVVPTTGLDPGTIHLALDRHAAGNHDNDARVWSDRWAAAAVAYPLLLPGITASEGDRIRSMTDRFLLEAEAAALTAGIVEVAKIGISRPRPYTYLPAAERPADSHYDVHADEAFVSMPSGHAATTWCAASFALTDYLLSHQDGTWKERATVGFTGGVLATTTAALRVKAGQHFPSDVLAGGAIGAACGAAVPLLHHYVDGDQRAPLPPARAWLQAVAGTATGVVAGLLLAPLFGN